MEGTIILGMAIASLLAITCIIRINILQRHTIRSQRTNINSLYDRLAAIRNSCDKLRKLCTYLQSVREDERYRVAHEIYDNVGQLLAAVKIEISLLGKELISSGQRNIKISSALADIDNRIGSSINLIRGLVAELRPEVLDHFGLMEAIKWEVNSFQHKTGIICFLHSSCDAIKIDQKRAVVFFRALEGILAVAARRPDVSNVLIDLFEDNGFLKMHVEDNGNFLNQNHIFNETALILMEIDERIRSIGGSFDIRHTTEQRMNATIVIKKHD